MKTINVTEAKAKFSEVVEQASKGECIILTRMGKPVAKVSCYEPARVSKRTGVFSGQIEMSEDFDIWPDTEARALGIIE